MNKRFLEMITESKDQTYMGKFNWKGEIHTLYTTAKSDKQAKQFMISRLAEKLKLAPYAVGYYYKTNPNSVKVTLTPEKTIV